MTKLSLLAGGGAALGIGAGAVAAVVFLPEARADLIVDLAGDGLALIAGFVTGSLGQGALDSRRAADRRGRGALRIEGRGRGLGGLVRRLSSAAPTVIGILQRLARRGAS